MAIERGTETQGTRQNIIDTFYRAEVPYGMALVRMLLPLVLLIVVVQRWPVAREIFSADGAPSPIADNYGYPGLLPELPGEVVVALLSALAFLLVASSIGWQTRFSLLASAVLYTYFNLMDSLSTMTKYSVIASHVMFLLAFSNCGAVWSVDRWLDGTWRRKRTPLVSATHWSKSAAWPRRLVQWLMCAVYFGAAITKMHTPQFFTGEQLVFWMMTNVNFDNPIGEYLTLYPGLLVVFAYIAIIWEVTFPFVVWHKGWGRTTMLSLGALFHVMTTLTLGLYIFPMVCISTYFAFLDEEDAEWFSQKFRAIRLQFHRWNIRVPAISRYLPSNETRQKLALSAPALFWVVLGASASGGMGLEHMIDPYGHRQSDGPYALEEVDPQFMARVLRGTPRIRNVDKLLHFAVGTRTVGGFLSNERTNFKQGERLIGQCVFNPPHEDMWVECNLHDANNRILDRTGQIVPRESLKTNYLYHLTEALRPGKYYLVIRCAGEEITRREITLNANQRASVAN